MYVDLSYSFFEVTYFPQAKNALCSKIDNYIQDRIIIADKVIQELAGNKIKDGDVILTFAR
jgi:translation initiation factor eIF-2B subunit delta